jgi:nitrate/TMAO reductase-like tetraheme cytochrome c subunit
MSEKHMGLSTETESWWAQLKASFTTPLGALGVCITTIFFVLSTLGLIAHAAGMVKNAYALIITIVLFPVGMIFGLLLIPLAVYMGRRKMFAGSLTKQGFTIDLGNDLHRKILLLILVLTVVNISLFATVAYHGYEFMDTPAFCGTVCHTVMAPEYAAHKHSPHANVACVDCHIGPGIGGFIKAKFSGLRQLKDMLSGSYRRPVPTPVEGLPAASVTCEKCHFPEKFFGNVKKSFISFSNERQENPEKQDILLYLGGRDPVKDVLKGIHWHAGHDIRIDYQPLKENRTKIAAVKLTAADGTVKVFTKGGKAKYAPLSWRRMDCVDCHSRPAHVFEDLMERVDFGLAGKKIHPEIPGIRQDSLTVLQKPYASRNEAAGLIVEDLKKLQEKRNGADFVTGNDKAITDSGVFLKKQYLDNIWPEMKITWGTYKNHIGHRYEKNGYGCFRCHDDEHATESGETISQDCGFCHKAPE